MMLRRAFTLIELLVVIAIIAILAAILFPVFARAKAAAKDSVALSNAKECGLACLMYATDYDDFFPLAVTGWQDPSTGPKWDGWQGLVQPYMKNFGVVTHPKLRGLPPDTTTYQWLFQSRMHWGMPLRSAAHSAYSTQGYYTYISGSMTGGVARKFDGIGGAGVQTTGYTNNGFQYPLFGTYTNVSSLSQTQVNNVADVVLICEANGPDMSWGLLPNPGGGIGPMNYWLSWSPAGYSPWDTVYTYCGPHSRKSEIYCNGGNNGAGGIQSICQGNLPWPDGLSTYVACDGSAKAVPWRGQITKSDTLSDGTTALHRLWPN